MPSLHTMLSLIHNLFIQALHAHPYTKEDSHPNAADSSSSGSRLLHRMASRSWMACLASPSSSPYFDLAEASQALDRVWERKSAELVLQLLRRWLVGRAERLQMLESRRELELVCPVWAQ
jgi:hypothetical protein